MLTLTVDLQTVTITLLYNNYSQYSQYSRILTYIPTFKP